MATYDEDENLQQEVQKRATQMALDYLKRQAGKFKAKKGWIGKRKAKLQPAFKRKAQVQEQVQNNQNQRIKN